VSAPPPRPDDYNSRPWGFPMPWSTWACFLSRTFPNSHSQLEMSCQWLVSFLSACKKRWPLTPVCGTKLELAAVPVALGHLTRHHSVLLFLSPSKWL
jgi:hypothetical protein